MKRLFISLLFVTALCSSAWAQRSEKVSPYLAGLAFKDTSTLKALSSLTSSSLPALATLATPCDAASFFQRHGCRMIDSIGRIYIVDIPLDRVLSIADNDTIERLEAERMPKPLTDVTPGQVNATDIYSGTGLTQAFTGTGVAAGVFDAYFDFTHPAFLDANGDTRVKYYYDCQWPNADGTYGHALQEAAEIAALEHSQYTRNGIHGTHVAGIMAGSEVDGFQGMAPDADLYLADFNSDREQFSNPDATTSATAVLGFKRIFDQATADGKPCVVNFSSGESIIFTSHRVLEGEALQALTGPGRIIVSSAGNDGTRACYFEKGADDYQAGTGIENGLFGGQIIDIDLITPGDQYVRFDFMGMGLTGGGIEGTIAFHTDSIDAAGSHFTATVSMGEIQLDVTLISGAPTSSSASNQTWAKDSRGTVYHIHGTMPNAVYLLLCGATVLLTSNSPAWMYSDIAYSPFLNVDGVPQYSFAQPGHSITWPAVLPGIIAVGATGYKNIVINIDGQENDDVISFAPDALGQRAKFSSCGPTFDGLTKPDVVAPGMNINSAYNSFYNDFAGIRKSLTHSVTSGGKTHYYLAESGTSMASPVVAGIIALWLQAKPDLTPAQAMEVISRTSTHPDATMTYPNNEYGYGQIDAYRGLLEVLELPVRIPELSQEQPKEVSFRVENDILYADFGNNQPGKILFNIYTLEGRLVLTQSGKSTVDLHSLPAGIYAVQLITDSKATTGSTLIRLNK